MAERSSSAPSLEEHSQAFQVGKDGGRGLKTKNNKKRRRGKKQKKEQCPEQSLESAESADSLVVMSTAEHRESKSNSAELPEQEGGGRNERPPAQVSGEKMAAERNEQGAGVLVVSAPNSTAAKVETGIPCKDTIAGKRKELLENTGPDTHDDGAEMIKKEEDKSDEQQQTNVKKKRDLLSFGRPKKNKTQRAKNARQKQNNEERNDTQVCVTGESESASLAAKSKDDGNEGREDKEIGEPSAKNEIDNSPESGETAENNKEQIGDYEKTREADAASSNKAKKFKPLASFRRHKKKADASTSASLEGQTAENAETKEAPKAAREDVEKGDSLSNEDGEKMELNEDVKRKTKKFSPLRSFRKSKTKKSTTDGENDDGAKQKSEKEQREDAGVELGQKPDVHQQVAQQSGAASLSEEYPGAENVELVPGQENIVKNECGADVDGEEMTPTKKAKKKGLLRRQMKKIWSTSGKAKEAASVEEEASVVNAEETKPDSCEQQESREDVPSPPVAADSGEKASDEILATEQERCEEKSSVETVEKTKEEEEVIPENAGREEESAQMDPAEKTGKTVAQQMKEVTTNKKRDKTNREDNGVGESAGVEVANNSETSKQVKRKKSGFRKISNALKKKKTGEEGLEMNDQSESEGLMEKEPEETDYQETVTEEVGPAEDGELPLEPDGKEENTETKYDHEVQKADNAEQSSELVDETEERLENSAGSMQAYRTHGDLMKPVIQELLAKIAKMKLVPASVLAAPEVDTDEESEFTKTSDDYSLTSVTNTATDNSNPSIVDVCSDSKDATESEQTAQESNGIEVDHDENPNDETTDVLAIEQPRVPSDPEGQQKPQLEESSKVAIPTSAAPVPENVPNTPDAEPSGNVASSQAVESDEDRENQEEGDKDEDEGNQNGQETQMTNSEDLVNSAAGLTSNLESSQAAPSKGRREDWILVNHLEISQELSHQLKVFALDSFEHGTPGCCNIM